MDRIEIQMLGGFSIRSHSKQISDNENRSKKVWLLLAYLIHHRDRVVTQDELIQLLWGDAPRGANPSGALKTTSHRARAALDHLYPSAGHQLILRKDGGYIWNTEIPISVDADRFTQLCSSVCDNEEGQLLIYLEALNLYQGDFLSRLPSEPWITPISAQLHGLYIEVLLKALPLLMERGRQNEAANLCYCASASEPYHEDIHRFLMRALLDLGNEEGAVAVYKEFSERLLSDFGAIPPESLRMLYYEATRTNNTGVMSIEAILDQLREPVSSGALMCEYDFFVVLCRSVARSMSRTGTTTHIALLSAVGTGKKELSKRSLTCIMDNLGELIRTGLRKGDAAARCSSSQYVLMLPQANYENSCMVCSRITKSFARQYPHSPAELHYMVYPLEPNI